MFQMFILGMEERQPSLLTEWLLKQVENYQQNEDGLAILTAPHSKVAEKPKP
jgi:hypothetical protein